MTALENSNHKTYSETYYASDIKCGVHFCILEILEIPNAHKHLRNAYCVRYRHLVGWPTGLPVKMSKEMLTNKRPSPKYNMHRN